jgi:hypothetical protein
MVRKRNGSSWLLVSLGAASIGSTSLDALADDGICGGAPQASTPCTNRRTSSDTERAYFDDIPGPWQNGLGFVPAGAYWVFLEWETDRRWAMKTYDNGECANYCGYDNTPSTNCPTRFRWMNMDGMKLRTSPNIHYVSGIQAFNGICEEDVQGPYNKSESAGRGDWEWVEGQDNTHCGTWATRRNPLIHSLYWVQWDGTAFSSQYQTQWREPDSGLLGIGASNTFSVRTTMDFGKALTQCLQNDSAWAAPQGYPLRFRLTNSSNASTSHFTHICDEEGGCAHPDEYKIEMYFNVYCRVMKSTWPNGTQTDWANERNALYNFVKGDDSDLYPYPGDGGNQLTPANGRSSLAATFGYRTSCIK